MEFVREIPSECLSLGEASGVWSGWSNHGDREIVREAAAKGTHIELAHKCLAYRRRCIVAEAKKYFADELEIWIGEMLEKSQIHRASHILRNAGKNPLEFIRNRCVKCREPKLRRYLADYVLAQEGFEAKHEEAWNVIKGVARLEEKHGSKESLMGDCSIEEIGQLPDDVRSSLVADLHFNIASCFSDKLNGVVLWDYLLANNKIDRMVFWIGAHCQDDADPADVQEVATDGEISLTSRVLQRLAIDEDIVELVATSGASYPVKELVLDRLSGYGIFTREERQHARSVLARFFSNRMTPEAFRSILLGFRCSVDPDEFEKQVFSIIYHRGASDCPASCANTMETGSLLELMTKMASRPEVTLLVRAIIKNIEVFHGDLETHIRDDPILLLTLFFLEHLTGSSRQFTKYATFRGTPKNDLNRGLEAIASETIQHSLEKIPYLAAALEGFSKSNEPTLYDLLNGYEGLDLARSFKWRDRKDVLPNFRSENLARNFGREEKLSYVHYLRESRASMAVRALERESEVNVQSKVKPRCDGVSCEADVNCTAHEKVKVNEGIEVEVELMDSEGFKFNDEVNEIKANDEARRFNNEIEEVKSETSKVKVNDEVEVYDEVEEAKVDQVKVHEDFDEVKVNEEVDRFKVHEDLDGRQSMSIDRPLMNKVNEIKLNKDAIKINVMMNEVDKIRKVKISEEVNEVKTKKGMKVNISDEVKVSEETRRSKISGEFDEVIAKKGMKVKNKVRVQIGGDIKVEMKVEAAAYARALALESGEDEVTCTCVAFIELLGLNSECLRVGATAWAYVNKCLGISIRDSLRSLSSSSSPRDVAAILRLLERSFEANLARDRSEDSSKVDLKGAIAVTDRPEVMDTLEANDEIGLKEIPGEDELKVALDGNTQGVLNCEGRPFNVKTVLKNTQSFVDASRTWEMIVGFARIHETSAPRSFIRLLALHDRRFEFVLVGQMFSYPLEAMLESAREFANPHVREHLCLAMRNTRLLATRSDHETRKFREFPDATGSEELEDLWTIVLRCHASRDPPGAFLEASRISRSPVLTVLAAFYEPSATSGFCYSWLVVSVGVEKLLREYEIPLREELWSARSVRLLLKSCLDLGYAGTLARAFLIFMPEHPLGRLFRAFLEDANHHEATLTFLRDFVEACANLGCNPGIDWDNTSNEDYLWNSRWIALVAVECSMSFVARCSSSLHLGLVFLELHTRARFNEELYVATPNFATLQRVVAILADTPVQLHFDAIQLDDRGSNVDREIQRCVDKLLDIEDFENALALSKVAGLRCSNIILAQYRSEFKRSTSDLSGSKLEPLFWKRCAGDLRKYEVSFDETAAFFIEYAEKVSSCKERYEILKLALESLEPIGTDNKTLDTVEMAMWKSCVLADPDSIDIETDPRIFNKLKAELLSGIVDLTVSCRLNDATEESAVAVLISRFVAAGQLATALHISAIFTYKHRDLQILMLCMSLAEGEISPYQLTSQQRSLLSETGRVKLQKYSNLRNRGMQRTSPGSTVPKVSPSVNEDSSHFLIEQIQVDTLSMIDRLTKSLESGSATGTRIMLCAKLATYLRRSYQSLLNLEDPMPLLYEVVGSNCDRKLEMVGDIVAIYRIKNESVAKFLAEEIIANTPRLVEDSLEDSLVMWGNPLGSNIQAIIELCNDPALLGWELLRAANLSLGNSHGERRNVLTLKVAIELLIRSHDCFTASCSMEGIASILRKAQHLVYTLQHRKHWSLLVRLVTGLGRFTEMNYVFQILKENDQFEFLLGKGLDKVPGLKTALLEFCKRQCPSDKELFTLIALHFTLYNEIAYKWESEAIEIMNEIVAEARKNSLRNATGHQIPLGITRNESVEKQLHVVVENFTHSTEYYLQDNKLNLASRCSHQAQLAALQISLLASVPQNHQAMCLINLGPDELNRAICQDLTLPQALALLQAYNHHGDWSSAIYSHLVMNGETRYLKEFMVRRSLTAPIVQDCVCRYRSEKTVTRKMTESMQILVSELNDLECKYVLASQLGFKRIIEDMLANPSTGSYLKDTVWKQGFKSTDFYE